jgi:aspartate aminotransferase-like enzyme
MMEGAIRSGVEDRVLSIVHGHFGERFARIAEACGREVIRLHTPRDRVLEPEDLEAMLDGPPVDAVTLVHVETSTGAAAPVDALLPVLRRLPDTVIILDVVGSLGGMPVETDRWGADLVLASSQKAIGAPAGLALGVASEQFLERARTVEDRGRYLDIVSLHADADAARFPQTPPLPVAAALAVQLDRIEAEGLETRWARHRAMRELIEGWMSGRDDLAWQMPAGRRSDTVSALRLPEERSAREVVAALEAEGWLVGTGMDGDADRLLRIGHLGDATPAQLETFLATLDRSLAA